MPLEVLSERIMLFKFIYFIIIKIFMDKILRTNSQVLRIERK